MKLLTLTVRGILTSYLLLVFVVFSFNPALASTPLVDDDIGTSFMDQTTLFSIIKTKQNNSYSNNNATRADKSNAATAIKDKIKKNIRAPLGSQGSVTNLHLKLDDMGNILAVHAQGSNPTVNRAVEKAAYAASPLPIDLQNPEHFSNIIVNVYVK